MLLCAVCIAKPARKAPERLEAYLFAYFSGNSVEGEQLRFAVSFDGFNYTPLNNGERVVDLDGVARWGSIRDPHILRGEDGRTFYMVMTDMRSGKGWKSNDGIVMMKSKDLVHWSAAAVDFPTAFPELYSRESLTRVWAPQTIYDREAGKYMVYYSLEYEGQPLTIFYSYADRNFRKLSRPEKLCDFGFEVIDADIVPTDSTYHMFLAGIWKTTAPTLKGPWAPVTGKRLQQTEFDAEGPGVFRLNPSYDADGGASEGGWCLMYDCFKNGMYQFCRSSDLENFSLTAQTEKKGAFTPRHGTVTGITMAELERLLEAFPSEGLTLETLRGTAMPDGCRSFVAENNPIFKHEFTCDPAPVVWGDTLWLFTGHDAVANSPRYNIPEWSLFSTTDMKHWIQHPSHMSIRDVSWDTHRQAYAAHAIRRDGKYYFYFSTNGNGIGVAVADRPEGPYRDALGKQLVRTEDCFGATHGWRCIDPAAFMDDDGQAWLFWGNGVPYYAKLKDNMIELDGEIRRVNLKTAGYGFTEAPWVHKYDGKYYFTYATGFPEKLAYAIGDSIDGLFEGQGLLAETAGHCNTTHPGIVEFKGQWYLFTHDGTLQNGGGSFSRSVTVYRLHHNEDGTISKVQLDSEGIW